VVSAGIGGGFAGVAPVGALVIADRIVAADLGAESTDGFLPLEQLGFGAGAYPTDERLTAELATTLRTAGLDVVTGTALTVSTVTGTAERAGALAARYPDAASEGMEGFGVATAAAALGIPVVELRAVSNAVGPRDRTAWRIGDALTTLGAAAQAMSTLRVPARRARP
jgi:futalosine hydrolase